MTHKCELCATTFERHVKAHRTRYCTACAERAKRRWNAAYYKAHKSHVIASCAVCKADCAGVNAKRARGLKDTILCGRCALAWHARLSKEHYEALARLVEKRR